MLNRLSLREQARLVASRQVSAAELVAAHLEEIERRDPEIHAFIEVYQTEAEQRAQQRLTGRLAGVPVTVKDSFDIAGRATRCGSRLRLNHRAAQSAWVVERLEAEGAIVLGKTSTPEFLANYETDNHLVGRTNHPDNPNLTPGGSSGGEAAAIAAFCSAGGVGSDGGGSIRWPAHCCRLAGLKPTPGRIPATGHYPVISHPGGMMGVAGPMARTVDDLALLFDVLAGEDPGDPFSAPVPLKPPPAGPLRIGLWPRFYSTPVQPACSAAVEWAAKRLADQGCIVEEFTPRGLERAPNLWSFLFTELSAPLLRDLIAGCREETHWTGTEFLDAIAGRPEPTGRQVVEVLTARDAMRAALLRQMAEIPIVLTVTAGMTAFPHRERRFPTPEKEITLFEGIFPLVWVNLLGLPALAAPVGEVTVQLVGRPWEETHLLAAGRLLAQ